MRARFDLDQRIADYYATQAPPTAPDWVLREALATIDVTPQRRVLIRAPWRSLTMDTDTKSVTAADQAEIHPRPQGRAWRLTSLRQMLPVLVATALLLAGLIGFALVAGLGSPRSDPDDTLTQSEIVAPFLGLPPEGARPSAPDTGELIFWFYAEELGSAGPRLRPAPVCRVRRTG